MAFNTQSGSSLADVRPATRQGFAGAESAAWRRFLLAILALGLALLLALYATGLSQSGRDGLAATMAFVSLLLAALVAVRVVPALARRTALRRLMIRVDYEFTRQGAVYLAMIAVITVAALNTGNNLLFIILSCMIAGILASGILSRIVLEGLHVELDLPEHIFARQPALVRLRLENRKQFFPTFSVTLSGRKHGRRAAAATLAILNQDLYVPYLPRRSSAGRNVTLTFPKRGCYLQPSLSVSTRFPFGFLRKIRSIPCGRKALVLPAVQPADKLVEILPRLGRELESYLKGRSHDLYAIRDYQQSDSARHVDWKATARVRQLKVREFTREDDRRLRLVFDRRVPNTLPLTLERFEKAVSLCASLLWYFYESGAVMSFVTDGFETPMYSAGQILYPVLEKLALIEPAIQGENSSSRLTPFRGQPEGFQIVLTHLPREAFPAAFRRASYFLWMDSL